MPYRAGRIVLKSAAGRARGETRRRDIRVKLRIRDNSIRLRLTQTETATLKKSGVVAARARFPGGRSLEYAVESSPASVTPAVHFSESRLAVRLPETVVLAWATSDQVSIQGEQRLEDGEVVSILVEKDFHCLAPREGEDESDMFPHPLEEPARSA